MSEASKEAIENLISFYGLDNKDFHGVSETIHMLLAERDALQARVAELEESAERWDALMASQRIRHFGSANFNWSMGHDEVTAPKDPENWLHLGIELWDRHSAPHPCEEFPQDRCRNFLLAYVDHIRQALKENQDD